MKTLILVFCCVICMHSLLRLSFSPFINIQLLKMKFFQVFINLFQNAAEAMLGGGHLHIQTRYIIGPPGEQPAGQDGKYRGQVRITVRDDGSGIPAEVKPRIFEPFTSSKGGGHPGLGLSIAHSIIQALNGTITCESKEEGGTAFQIELPIVNSKKET